MPVHTTNSSGCFSEIKKSRYFKEMILFIIIVLKFHINMITLKEDSHHGMTLTFVFGFWILIWFFQMKILSPIFYVFPFLFLISAFCFSSPSIHFCCSTSMSPTLDYSRQFLALLKSCETQDKFDLKRK